MQSTFISKEGSGSASQADKGNGGKGTERFQHIVLSNLKYFLPFPRINASQLNSDPEDVRCDPSTHLAKSGSSASSKTLVAVGVLLSLTLMILVFLWNYKCIVIDKTCEGSSEMLTPVFRND